MYAILYTTERTGIDGLTRTESQGILPDVYADYSDAWEAVDALVLEYSSRPDFLQTKHSHAMSVLIPEFADSAGNHSSKRYIYTVCKITPGG